MSSSHDALVCDNGSFALKIGFAGDDAPRTIIPSIIGTPLNDNMEIPEYGQRSVYCGQMVRENMNNLNTKRPIQNGIITDWDAMEDIWTHMYYENLLVPSEKYGILHTEPINNPASCRQKLTETMFELFNVPSMALVPKSTLALYCNGKTTGLVIDSGYETTQVVPIYEGFPLTQAAKSMPVGGRHVTDYLMKLLNDRGYDFKTEEDLDNLREIKRKYCYCALNVEKELAAFGSDQIQRHKLPDGTVIEIHAELFQCPEVIFDPALLDIKTEYGGVHNMVHKAVGTCDDAEQNTMYNNIVLAGANTLFPYLSDRLQVMVAGLIAPETKIKISDPPERAFSTWIGGSIFASSHNFQKICINKNEYEEHGSGVVHHKTFF